MHDILSVYKGTYDAWGNIVSKSGSMADINPFRYRGYYYDTETGFYYLQTRYYDPSIRQFINADNYELLPILSQTIGQLNLYAYANNNPIMLTDETGESVTFVLFLIGFTLVGAGVGLVVGLSKDHEGWQLAGDIALGAVIGFMTGALVASVAGSAGVVFKWTTVLGFSAKEAFVYGAVLYDFTGFVVAAFTRVRFQPIEVNPSKQENLPTKEPLAIIRPYSCYVIGGVI